MEKNEILQKSRNEKHHEYEEQVLKDSSKFTSIILATVCVIFGLAKMVFLDGQPVYDIAAILFFVGAAQNAYIYYKLKDKSNLIASFCFAIPGVITTVMYFASMYGIVYGR